MTTTKIPKLSSRSGCTTFTLRPGPPTKPLKGDVTDPYTLEDPGVTLGWDPDMVGPRPSVYLSVRVGGSESGRTIRRESGGREVGHGLLCLLLFILVGNDLTLRPRRGLLGVTPLQTENKV